MVDNLRDFRVRHSDLCGGTAQAELGAVRESIRDYYCRNFRQNCAGGTSAPSTQVGIGLTNYVSPINKAADWLTGVASQRVEHVDAALAAQRAQICAQCSQNVQWQTGCAPCNQNVQVRTQQAKGSLATPYDRNLMVCRTWGWMNEVAVWMQNLPDHPDKHPPGHCWRVTEKQSGLR